MNNPEVCYKAVFEGSTSTGKSTLLEIYKNRFKNPVNPYPFVQIIDEVARRFFKENPESDRSTEVQMEIQNRVKAEEHAAESNPTSEILLGDRSVAAGIVITKFYGDDQGAQKLLNNAYDWLPTYDTFLLLDPTGIPYEQDVFRRETTEERLAMHQAYEDFFIEHGLPYHIISGSKAERIKQIDSIILPQIAERIIFDKKNDSKPASL